MSDATVAFNKAANQLIQELDDQIGLLKDNASTCSEKYEDLQTDYEEISESHNDLVDQRDTILETLKQIGIRCEEHQEHSHMSTYVSEYED